MKNMNFTLILNKFNVILLALLSVFLVSCSRIICFQLENHSNKTVSDVGIYVAKDDCSMITKGYSCEMIRKKGLNPFEEYYWCIPCEGDKFSKIVVWFGKDYSIKLEKNEIIHNNSSIYIYDKFLVIKKGS